MTLLSNYQPTTYLPARLPTPLPTLPILPTHLLTRLLYCLGIMVALGGGGGTKISYGFILNSLRRKDSFSFQDVRSYSANRSHSIDISIHDRSRCEMVLTLIGTNKWRGER